MLSKKIRILNFDASLTKQADLLDWYKPQVVDFSQIGPNCRHWINNKYLKLVRQHLSPELKNAITFIGSGDFHHISSILIGQFQEPISVIVFDHHPDWNIFPPRVACGSWVSNILKKKNIKKLVSFGPSSSDLDDFLVLTGDLDSFKDGRLEIYPYAHKPTECFFRKVPDNSSIGIQSKALSSKINWKELKGKNLSVFFASLINRIPTRQVYVSIDKDCLKSKYALTNWEEGNFELDELLSMLKIIKSNFDIVGLDVTGDYSQVRVKGLAKRIISHMDHPKDFSAKSKADDFIASVNQETNLKILDTLLSAS